MKTKEIAEQLLNKLYAENRASRSQSEFVIGAIDIISKALEEAVNEQKAIDNDLIEELNDLIAKYESDLCELNAWKDDMDKRKLIDEDKLDELAEQCYDLSMPFYDWRYAFKAGYRKAMEE